MAVAQKVPDNKDAGQGKGEKQTPKPHEPGGPFIRVGWEGKGIDWDAVKRRSENGNGHGANAYDSAISGFVKNYREKNGGMKPSDAHTDYFASTLALKPPSEGPLG